MKQFGLLGHRISYSFSKNYFEEKFNRLGLTDHQYDIFDLENIQEVATILENKNVIGFNVTKPFKIDIIPFLDKLSEEAKQIGAVNTVKIENGIKKGYNTDAFGFEKTLATITPKEQLSALILGDGGAAQAVKFVLTKKNIPFKVVSRKGKLNFKNLKTVDLSEHQLIIQTTPVGTFPNTTDCLQFPFEAITKHHSIIDLIYNPNETQFMKNAQKHGAETINGLLMLHQQAEKSWEIWTNTLYNI